jgi:hypothetical protein
MVHRENGLAARLLLAYPPRQPRRWTEAEISLAVKHAVNKLFNGLLSLPAKRDESGNIEPIDLPLNDDAKSRFARFVNEHGAEQYNTTYGDLAAVWSKLEAYAARFALIFHFIRLVGNDPTLMYAEQVDAASIEAGIALAEWFGSEARRIYGILAESEDEQATGELVELIQRHGGEITAHDLSKTCRSRFPRAEDAEAALNALAKSDYGVLTNLVPGSKGGRPTSIFRLNSIHQNPKTPVIAEKIEVSGYCPKRIDRKDEIRKVKKE